MDVREFGAQVEDLEKKLDRLRAMYEQYFMGIEKIEPGVLRRDFERHLQALRRERCNNTAQRFRFQVLLQRYTTLTAYWQRICRAIEEGTYEPHIQRAKRRIARVAPEPGALGPGGPGVHDLTDVVDLDLEPESLEAMPGSVPPPPPASMPPGPGVAHARSLEDLKRFIESSSSRGSLRPPDQRPTVPPPAGAAAVAAIEVRPIAAPPPPPAPAGAVESKADRSVAAAPSPSAARTPAVASGARPAAARSGAVAEDKVRSIHAAFAAAAKGAAAPSPGAIRKSLEQELERMTKKHPGKRVDFRVDLKDGKPVIKSFVS